MNDQLDDAVRAAAKRIESTDKALQDIFLEAYADRNEAAQPNPAYEAYKLAAVETSVALMNLFMGIRFPKEPRTYRVACDLTFGLNNNLFWTKNAAFLVPMVQVALNAFADGIDVTVANASAGAYANDDSISVTAKYVPLEIFPAIAYLLGGPLHMRQVSLKLKRDLAPFMR